MENEIIKNISIKDLKEYSCWIDYVDDDIIVTNSLEDILGKHNAVRLNFFLIVFCREGHIQLNVNNQAYSLHKNDMLTLVPSSIFGQVLMSNTLKVRIFGFSLVFVNDTMKGEKGMDSIFNYMQQNPVRHLQPSKEDEIIYNHYGDLIMNKIKGCNLRFQRRILLYLFSSLYCEIVAEVSRLLEDRHVGENETRSVYHIYRNFMKELSRDDGCHRSVSHYADLLCYSPKYLSYAVKQASGRTAMEWINEHTINLIKFQLRTSDKSIKEIAELFKFPNLSFFGKYVKRNLGMSPAQYKNNKLEEQNDINTQNY